MGRKKRVKAAKITTLLGSDIRVQGDVLFSGGMHVDGTVQGNIIATDDPRATLILSEKSTVEGDVKAPNIVLNGKVVGDVVSSEMVELAPNARVFGTLYYNLLEMAMGAEINGQLIYTEDAEPEGEVEASAKQAADE